MTSTRSAHPDDLPSIQKLTGLGPRFAESDLDDLLVEEEAERVVAAGRLSHIDGQTHEVVEFLCLEDHGAALLEALAASSPRPLMARIIPGTAREAAARRVGGRIVRSLPAACIPTGHTEVREWSSEHQGPTITGDQFPLETLVDGWVDAYVATHADFSPVTDIEQLRARHGGWLAESLERSLTRVAMRDGQMVAACYVWRLGDERSMPMVVTVQPHHPEVIPAAAACVAGVFDAVSPAEVEFDGHDDEPVYMAVLQTIPQRGAGSRTPMDLTEIRLAHRSMTR